MANVIVLQNVTIALRTVQKLMVQLDSSFQGSQIGPVEPVGLKVKAFNVDSRLVTCAV